MPEKKPTIIERSREQSHSLDFAFLRQHGIALIQQLSGDTWTDYNLHDPGVTILEQLCFAITDLAYRTDFPIRERIAGKDGNIRQAGNTFFHREEILTTNPVTVRDFRKAILDEIDDVYNVWLEPVLSSFATDFIKGLYKIQVQVDKETAERLCNEKGIEEQIRDRVRRSFVSKRNLCEDFVRDIVILRPVKINISADITIREKMNPEETLGDIYSKLDDYLNPPVRYFSENELSGAGTAIAEIYAGPLLKKGIIPDKDLCDRRREINPDDLVRVIMQVPGVMYVRNLVITDAQNTTGNGLYLLDEFSFPLLDITASGTGLRIFKEKNEIHIGKEIFNGALMKVREMKKGNLISPVRSTGGSGLLSEAERKLEFYYSIQDHFPSIYGIGPEGLAANASKSRMAQAKQLKAYLMLFEQLLANYLSQLVNCDDLFSTALDKENAHTYYSQPLYNVPGAADLLKAFTETIGKNNKDAGWESFKSDPRNEYMLALQKALETDDTYRERKNQVLDHLLARFNMQPNPYPVRLFNLLYGDPAREERIDETLRWKADILDNIVELSRDRIKAADYLSGWAAGGIEGFGRMLSKLLYIRSDGRSPLSKALTVAGHPGNSGGARPGREHAVVEINPVTEPGPQGTHPHPFIFDRQTSAVFRYGIDIANYKIMADVGENKDHLIMYKDPAGRQWNFISRHPDKSSAVGALKKLIDALKQVNIESEGFHIVEHILLRAPLKDKSFGFGFYEKEGHLLFQHNEWASFEERETVINKILDAERGEKGNAFKDFMSRLSGLCKIQLYKDGKPSFFIHPHSTRREEKGYENDLENMLMNIRLFKQQPLRFFPRFDMMVRLPDGTAIEEDFFNSRMTVVLPAWPARFQDENFRGYTESLFQLNAPAHIRINFRWLDIFEMKNFEAHYFKWLDFLKKQTADIESGELSEKLITFLNIKDHRRPSIRE